MEGTRRSSRRRRALLEAAKGMAPHGYVPCMDGLETMLSGGHCRIDGPCIIIPLQPVPVPVPVVESVVSEPQLQLAVPDTVHSETTATAAVARRSYRSCPPIQWFGKPSQLQLTTSTLTHKVCFLISHNPKQQRIGEKVVAKTKLLLPPNVQLVAHSFEHFRGLTLPQLNQHMLQYHAILIGPAFDPDKKITLDQTAYVREYMDLCKAIFIRNRCVPTRTTLMNIFDKVNVLTLLTQAAIPTLPWRIFTQQMYHLCPKKFIAALNHFAETSPEQKIVLKAPYTTTGRGVRFLHKTFLQDPNIPNIQAFFDKLFRPGFSNMIVQHYTPHFKSYEEHRLYFAQGTFVMASGTLRYHDRPLQAYDIPEELAIATDVLTRIPWLCNLPHLRIDFGRCSRGRLFVLEVEPTADIFSENDAHMNAIARSFARQATAILDHQQHSPRTITKADVGQRNKYALIHYGGGELFKLSTFLHRDHSKSEGGGLSCPEASITLQDARVLRKRKTEG